MGREKAAKDIVEQLQVLKGLAAEFKSEYNIDISEIIKEPAESVPLSIFKTKKLSSLEIIVKYLKENQKKKYHEIAVLLNRDDRTIWATYNNCVKKHKKGLSIRPSKSIPISIFSNRKFSVLESLVIYLKDQGHSFNKISELLLKDYQTVYTSYRRGRLKYGK